MKKIILTGTLVIITGIMFGQTSAPVRNTAKHGLTVNQRGDINEATSAGSKSQIRNGKAMFTDAKDMKTRRHHRHHGHHRHHHQNINKNNNHQNIRNRAHRIK